jgi:hypothetical protein
MGPWFIRQGCIWQQLTHTLLLVTQFRCYTLLITVQLYHIGAVTGDERRASVFIPHKQTVMCTAALGQMNEAFFTKHTNSTHKWYNSTFKTRGGTAVAATQRDKAHHRRYISTHV